MWTLAVLPAIAQEPAPAVPEVDVVVELPWRLPNSEGWTWADRRATRLARGGAWAAGIGGAVTFTGAALVIAGEELGNDGAIAAGAFGAAFGTISMVTAPPIALAGAMRAR